MSRRMFSTTVVNQDKFLDMPADSQLLYFHLGMSADDDGFVSPKRVIRMIGASEDSIKILIMKGFVIPFENGGVIVITHWKVNNLVRKDWYRPTTFQDQKALISLEKGNVYELLTNRQRNVDVGNELKKEEEIRDFIDQNKPKFLP